MIGAIPTSAPHPGPLDEVGRRFGTKRCAAKRRGAPCPGGVGRPSSPAMDEEGVGSRWRIATLTRRWSRICWLPDSGDPGADRLMAGARSRAGAGEVGSVDAEAVALAALRGTQMPVAGWRDRRGR